MFTHEPHKSGISSETEHKTTTVDMTSGSIFMLLFNFCVPLILGNFFQVLYNTVDSMVVGNFVGTEALAAVAATSALVNIAVFSFNGLSIGAGIVIGQYFGAHDEDRLHKAIETTMAITIAFGIFFTFAGVIFTPIMLRFISTPEDVMGHAVSYLRIYFAGVSGLLVYNMGSGILRAVGDSRRPLYFLIVSTLTNIVLDLVFVVVFHWGIAGAAFATIISQFLSAALVLFLLLTTGDIYRFVISDLHFNIPILKRILGLGLPAAFQSMITSLSNTVVVAYINAYGSAVMAGWGCYNKLDQVLMLPIQSMGHSSSTFVSQNIGANKPDRARDGTRTAILMIVAFNFFFGVLLIVLSGPAMSIFTQDPAVIESGIKFCRANAMFFLFNGVSHTLAGSLRGRGNAKAPMFIMLSCFVVIRQIYLLIITRLVTSYILVGLSYPVGWIFCCFTELLYYKKKYLNKKEESPAEAGA